MDEGVNVTQGDAVMRSAHATKVPQSGYRRTGEPSRRVSRPPQASWIDRDVAEKRRDYAGSTALSRVRQAPSFHSRTVMTMRFSKILMML